MLRGGQQLPYVGVALLPQPSSRFSLLKGFKYCIERLRKLKCPKFFSLVIDIYRLHSGAAEMCDDPSANVRNVSLLHGFRLAPHARSTSAQAFSSRRPLQPTRASDQGAAPHGQWPQVGRGVDL